MIDISSAHAEVNKAGLYDTEGNLKFVPFIHDGDGCSYWRIRKPFEAMGLNLADQSKTLEEYLSKAKVVTFNRTPGFKIEDLIKLKVKYGFKVVIDWDDYWILPHDHLIYHSWNRNRMPELAESMIKELADHVTTTTERLAEKIRPINPNVTVIPNAIPIGMGQWEVDQNRTYGGVGGSRFQGGKIINDKGTRFGYVAGSSHLPDIKIIQPVLNHFPKLMFSLAGYNNPDERKGSKNVWDQIERIASFSYHNPNYRRIKTMHFDEYAAAYDQVDVAIAPLKDNPFNKFKSSLKAYEAGAKKVAFICSHTAPYTDDIPESCVTFCEKNADWVDAFKKHQDIEFVKDKAAALHEWVCENRDLNKLAADRLEFFNSII
jgi:hypothetical protein